MPAKFQVSSSNGFGFYDEQGNLVQTYNNPLHDFPEQMEKIPFFGSLFQPLYNFVRPASSFSVRPMTYMIPVSDEVIHQIASDPLMQNKLILPARDAVIEMNSLCSGKRAQIPSPKLCNAFLNCWDGWAVEQECPNGLLFSVEGYCDYPQRVDCNNRRTNDKPAPQPRCASDFEAFRSDSSCSEFFVCVNRQPVRFLCPADLAFNQDLGICDYPDRVNCSIPASAPQTTAAPAPAAPASTSDATPPPDTKTVLMRSSVYNTQSWSTHVAMSRQDAIRQLQLGRIANVNTYY
ncbi:hypothetical protein MSG28_000188 [Choristoneura fumiferana]|uniref:Uncharacterized protein n=1 Tax=Choristoneura fumiferana TaxID=7141 RepID=A0ACC0JZH0_CHOFU|nr:hypothetical protein MSG28_000188 [Choristoneura fumiferana]